MYSTNSKLVIFHVNLHFELIVVYLVYYRVFRRIFQFKLKKIKKSSSKKFLIFQEMETLKKLLIFRETEPFSPSSRKQKSPPRKEFLIFREMELSNSKIKKFLIFSQKIAFLIFPEMEPCIFRSQTLKTFP